MCIDDRSFSFVLLHNGLQLQMFEPLYVTYPHTLTARPIHISAFPASLAYIERLHRYTLQSLQAGLQ